MSPPPHHPEEDTENPKRRNENPPIDERLRSAIPPRPERPSEAAGPAATLAEGTETLAAFGIASFSFFSSRTRSYMSASHTAYTIIIFLNICNQGLSS
jgi:hypothetical protein